VLLLVVIPAGGGDTGETWARITSYGMGERMFFLFIGLQASFIEESLFRGYLQPILSRRVGAVAAWLLTAILFGVSHLSIDPLRLAGITFIGLVYGALRLGDRSLVAPSVAHTLTWLIWGFA
jgi:membrane protease YdiL (CAAX protease family)